MDDKDKTTNDSEHTTTEAGLDEIAMYDPAELVKKFDALEAEFLRAHGKELPPRDEAPPPPPQKEEPRYSPPPSEDIPLTLETLYSYERANKRTGSPRPAIEKERAESEAPPVVTPFAFEKPAMAYGESGGIPKREDKPATAVFGESSIPKRDEKPAPAAYGEGNGAQKREEAYGENARIPEQEEKPGLMAIFSEGSGRPERDEKPAQAAYGENASIPEREDKPTLMAIFSEGGGGPERDEKPAQAAYGENAGNQERDDRPAQAAYGENASIPEREDKPTLMAIFSEGSGGPEQDGQPAQTAAYRDNAGNQERDEKPALVFAYRENAATPKREERPAQAAAYREKTGAPERDDKPAQAAIFGESSGIPKREEKTAPSEVDERAEKRRMERERSSRERKDRRDDRDQRPRPAAAAGAASGKKPGNGSKNPPQNGRKKAGKKKKRKKESLPVKIIKGIISVIVIFFIAVAVIGGVYVYSVIKDIPRYTTEDIEASLSVMSTMYNDQGQPMKNIYLPDGQRTLATYQQFPDNLVNALVAIEDKTFWTHKGFNIIRIFGAVFESVGSGSGITGASGTSTLTQQLARNIWLIDERSDRSIDRKIKEAFYARELETHLSKEEILRMYLNTIALGNHSYGIVAAAENYFGKKVENLDLIECAALAALPKAPSEYMMIVTVMPGEVAPDDPRILLAGSQYYYLYNDAIEPRLKLVLSEMLAQGYITEAEHDAALKDNIRSHLKPKEIEATSSADFFVSFAIDNIADHLLESDPGLISRDAALQKIYSGGLDIYTTFNQRAQDIAMDEYSKPENFPKTLLSYLDGNKNIMNEEKTNILLFNYDYMFETRDDGPWFHLKGGEDPDYTWREDGSMIIFADKRLGVYRTEGGGGELGIELEFKDFYTLPEGVLYMARGGQIPIPAEYKGIDSDGNLILSKKYFDNDNNIFTIDEEGEYWIGPKRFTLRQEVLQPQSAFVLIDHTNGQLKAMVGGRDIKGQFQYNRALSPRPPGSTIKPIGVYAPAIEMSANGEQVGSDIPTYGTYWSPLSIIVDDEMEYKGRIWPRNWYGGYRGAMTLRTSIEQSVNVNAVKAQLAIGDQRSITFLKKLGFSTLVEEGYSNDLTPAALALGGMTRGLMPLEIASAYGSFANAGLRVEPISYTLVQDKRGNVLLDGTPKQTQVMDPGTAFIMNDMLRTAVASGIATAAGVQGTQVAGKTGTTSDYYDAWFVGNTPKYSAAVWIGCDVSVRLSEGSVAASRLFSKIITQIIDGEDQGDYPPQPENVVSATVWTKPMSNPDSSRSYTDFFIAGTVPQYLDLGVEELDICFDSNYLATPWCPNHGLREYSTYAKPIDEWGSNLAPTFYCHKHNLDIVTYPYNYPFETLDTDFGKISVPKLVGLHIDDAIENLRAAGLNIGEIFIDPNYSSTPIDIVVSQNPYPNDTLPEGAIVNVTVSRGPDPSVIPEEDD